MRTKYWEDFKLGEKYLSPALTVTETHIVNFASLTGDFYPLHMDEEYAKQTQFGGRIAHGPLIFSLAVGLIAQAGIFKDSLVAFLGADRMRFLMPVKAGDTIHVEVEVTARRESANPARGIVTILYSVKNQRSEVVATFDMNFLMHRITCQECV